MNSLRHFLCWIHHGHDERILRVYGRRMWLECLACGAETKGWSL